MKKAIVLFVILSLTLCGCGSKEEKAKELYNKGKNLAREGKVEEAKKIFHDITQKYGSTDISLKVQEELDALVAADEIKKMTEEAESETCKNNLKRIGIALCSYALDHSGNFPPTLLDLDLIGDDHLVLYCPTAKAMYSYKSGLNMTTTNYNDAIVQCPSGVHKGADKYNILYVDGHVKSSKTKVL